MSRGKTAALVVLFIAAGVMAASSVRVRTMTPAGVGVVENPQADGMAKLQFIQSVPEFGGLPGIRAHVHLHTFRPNTTYGIVIDAVSGFVDNPQAVTTNGGGNANWVVLIPSNGNPPDSANSIIIVYRETVTDNGYTPSEERAMGMPD